MQNIRIIGSAGEAIEVVLEKICEEQGLEGEALEACLDEALHDEDAVHFAEEIVEGVEDAVAANPILPATNELIWGALSFLILFVLLAKFGFPAVKKGMEERTQRIQDQIDEADRAQAEAATLQAQYASQLADAKNEAARIMEEARQQADEYKQNRESQLDAELTERRQQAAAEIESQKTQAIAELRQQVGELAIGAAEQVVNSNLDRDANQRIVENFISSVGSAS